MATSYSCIYDRALFKFRDYDLASIDESSVEDVLHKYLDSAVSDFASVCKIDLLEQDQDTKEFSNDLTDECQEILALGIAYYWLSSKILNDEMLRNKMSTKDYQYFSPANLLRESQTLRDNLRKEYMTRINLYTYRHANISTVGEE